MGAECVISALTQSSPSPLSSGRYGCLLPSLPPGWQVTPYDARILGNGDFVRTMLQKAEEEMARQVRYHASKSSIAAVIKGICKEAGVERRGASAGWAKEEGVGGTVFPGFQGQGKYRRGLQSSDEPLNSCLDPGDPRRRIHSFPAAFDAGFPIAVGD